MLKLFVTTVDNLFLNSRYVAFEC